MDMAFRAHAVSHCTWDLLARAETRRSRDKSSNVAFTGERGHNLKPVSGKMAAGKDVIRNVGPCLVRTTLTRPGLVRLINTRARFIIREEIVFAS